MNCFRILGINETSDKRVIKKAYANMIKKHHPEDDIETYMRIKEAYEKAMKYASGNMNYDKFNHISRDSVDHNNKSNFNFKNAENRKSYKKDQNQFFDYGVFDDSKEEFLISYNKIIKKINTLYFDLDQRYNSLKWKEILDTDEFRKIIVNNIIRDRFEQYLLAHKNIPQSVWKVINDICNFVNVDNIYFKSLDMDDTSIPNYMYNILQIKDELSIKEVKKIDKDKIEEFLSMRFNLQYLILMGSDYDDIMKEFRKLKKIYDKDSEVYYIMAKELMSYLKDISLIDMFRKNKKSIANDNIYYIEKALYMIEQAMRISDDPKYKNLYDVIMNEYEFFKNYVKTKTLIKRASILFIAMILVITAIERVFVFYGDDDLLKLETFVIADSDYSSFIYGGTLDKDKALEELKKSNINSKEDLMKVMDYLKGHKLSKSFLDDYNAYESQKKDELQKLRQEYIDKGQDPDNIKSIRTKAESLNLSIAETNKGNDTSKFDQEQQKGTTKITLYDVTIDDRNNQDKAWVYDTFYHYMAPLSGNKKINDDFLCYYEDMIGNYYAQTGYRAGYLSFNESLKFISEFINPVLDAYSNKSNIAIMFTDTESIRYSVKTADEYMNKFKDSTLGDTKINVKFDYTKYDDNLKLLSDNQKKHLSSGKEYYINQSLADKYILGYRIDYVTMFITVLVITLIYTSFIGYEIIKIKKIKRESFFL